MLQQYAVFAILLTHVTHTESTSSDDCAVKSGTVTCQHTIPIQLPDHTTQVYIHDWLHESTGNAFNHSSWSTVVKLDITVTNLGTQYKKFPLYNMQVIPNLHYLGYHSPNLNSIRHQRFNRLNKLRTLNLADCAQLEVGNIMRKLNATGILPVLDTLVLDRVDTIYGKSFELDKTFVDVLYYKNITHLSLSGIMGFIKDAKVLNRQLMLENLNISNSSVNIIKTDKVSVYTFIKHLKTLDVSFYNAGTQFPAIYGFNMTIDNCSSREKMHHIPVHLENVYANNLKIGSFVNSYVDLSDCPISFKVVHLAGNKLKILDITIKWPFKINLHELDLSNNQMTYLSPAALSGVSSMQSLFLSFNRLSFMENTLEFLELFQTFKLLEQLTLASNGLSKLPEKMFEKNIHMKVLDLSGNELTSVTFQTKQLKALQYLNLSNNKISIIDPNMMLKLDNLPVHTIDLSRNPFQCACESMDSVRWLVHFQEINSVSYTCEFEGKETRIDNIDLTDTWYQCHKTKTLIGIILACIVCVVVSFFTIRIIRNHQSKDAIKRFVRNYRHGNIPESFLVMLSYSSHDGDFVLDNIYPTLESHLRERLRLDKDIVCIDDKHFRPGFSIVEEMMDHIRDSCVVVFVVSNSFCERHWCTQEVEEAYIRGKPVILMMLEDVDLAIMPAHLRDLFDRYTRSRLVVDTDGRYQLKPSWTLLCQSILELASQKQLPQ